MQYVLTEEEYQNIWQQHEDEQRELQNAINELENEVKKLREEAGRLDLALDAAHDEMIYDRDEI